MQETNQSLIHIVKFIYNDGYASIDVSQECRDKYKELYSEELDKDIMGCRTNPRLIKVFELLGYDKCSGSPSCIRLEVMWIPKELEKHIGIRDYDGMENVYVDYNSAYAEILHLLMKHNCNLPKEAYEKYQRINYIKEKMVCLRTREINETPDTSIFTYTAFTPTPTSNLL